MKSTSLPFSSFPCHSLPLFLTFIPKYCYISIFIDLNSLEAFPEYVGKGDVDRSVLSIQLEISTHICFNNNRNLCAAGDFALLASHYI